MTKHNAKYNAGSEVQRGQKITRLSDYRAALEMKDTVLASQAVVDALCVCREARGLDPISTFRRDKLVCDLIQTPSATRIIFEHGLSRISKDK